MPSRMSSRIQIKQAQEGESKKFNFNKYLFQLQFSLITFGFLRELSVSYALKSK